MPDFNFVDCNVYIGEAAQEEYDDSDYAPIAGVSVENYLRRAIANGVDQLLADIQITDEGRVLITFGAENEAEWGESLSYSVLKGELRCANTFSLRQLTEGGDDGLPD